MHYMLSFLLALAVATADAPQPFRDRTHFSRVLGENRNYRIFLPRDYEASNKRYPVIYYFHGHSDRYTLERYDNGTDTVPKIAGWVAGHQVIVVAVDGYVARDCTGFYGGSPWDVRLEGGDYDFGAYFQELAAHIDTTYRTLPGRRYRATSGLSMGGFMSLWLSARYPRSIGSASAFNPGPEFYVGDKGRRELWRPKDHAGNHAATMVRLIRASGDYISQYHEETRDAYARAHDVDFEYRQDEYHRHWATSIAETFDFHLKAFSNAALDRVPETWNHADAYRRFEVWGYRVDSDGKEPAIVYLEKVNRSGWRVTTRRWAPDGPPAANHFLTIKTAPIYKPGQLYNVLDHGLATSKTARKEATADSEGRITVSADGLGHQISIAGAGIGKQAAVLLPVTRSDRLRVAPNIDVPLPVRIYNPGSEPITGLTVVLSSEYPTVRFPANSVAIARLEGGAAEDLSDRLRARFTAGGGYFAAARLRVTIKSDGQPEVSENIDVLIAPEIVPRPLAVEILDGRTVTLNVFRQKGNQGGGESIQRTITEGKGNGNGLLEPGEEATIWVRMAQGMDPFDKNNWYRAKVYSDSPWIAEIADIQEPKQREWTSAMERTSVMRLAAETPPGEIPLLLDNESWSFHYTPDVRYGVEKLYQAFQLHTRHLHRYTIKVLSGSGAK
jgi:pimeloyl-ACP methyl ester carboxylesterase